MNAEVIALIARILLRYGGGALVSAGVVVSPSTLADPDVLQVTCLVLGLLCSAVSEGLYCVARKRNWNR